MAKLQVIGITALSLFISSCAHVPQGSEEQVAGMMQERIGKTVMWNRTCYEDPCVTSYVQNLVYQPINIESAVQIALLNNPQVQATFEEIGIAQADLVEAGLFTNPAFSIEVRYPYETKLRTNIEYLITATFLDIFLIPLRTRLASTELEQAKLRVANEILDLAFEVRQTYYELVAELQMLKYTQAITELASIQSEIALKQQRVGNIYQLDLDEVQAIFLEADLQITKSEQEIIRLREKLNRLLGLSEEICLTFTEQLPEETDYQGFDLCQLESIALQERVDLQVARFEILRFSRMLGLKDWWTYTNLQAGLAGERDPDGSNLIGPGFAGEIPIFNYGQAARMRLFAQLRQAQDRLTALEIRVLSEVRESHKRLMKDLKIINKYRAGIIPLQNKIINSSEELYNVMGLGVDRLLMNKRRETESYRNYLLGLRDYWIARVKLDHALGGYLFRLLPQESNSEGVE
jgi:cobalt-zinc-cadmium efflux system outer membrane protein